MTKDRTEIPAERAVIGCVLLDPDSFWETDLPVDTFRDPGLRRIYQAITDLTFEGEPVDPITVASKARCEVAAVEACRTSGLQPQLISTYARRIADAHVEKQTRDAARKILTSGRRGDELVSEAHQLLMQVGEQDDASRPVKASEVADGVVNEVERRHRGEPPAIRDVLTGVPPLDDFMAVKRGGVICIAGRPSMGKSTLARTLSRHFLAQGERIYALTTECSKEETIACYVAELTGIPAQRIMGGRMSTEEMRLIHDARREIDDWNLWIDDQRCDLPGVLREIGRQRVHNQITMLVADYLQRIHPGAFMVKDERLLMNAIIRGLVSVCRGPVTDRWITQVWLSQLTREVDKREDKRPGMADLRESGKIEDEAHMILMLYRPAAYPAKPKQEPPSPSELQVGIPKNRFGPKGLWNMRWSSELGLIDGVLDEGGMFWPLRPGLDTVGDPIPATQETFL
jgi:replicative DNA helicase